MKYRPTQRGDSPKPFARREGGGMGKEGREEVLRRMVKVWLSDEEKCPTKKQQLSVNEMDGESLRRERTKELLCINEQPQKNIARLHFFWSRWIFVSGLLFLFWCSSNHFFSCFSNVFVR